MSQINGVVRPCYICDKFTPRPPRHRDGITICDSCNKQIQPPSSSNKDASMSGLEFRIELDFEPKLSVQYAGDGFASRIDAAWKCGCSAVVFTPINLNDPAQATALALCNRHVPVGSSFGLPRELFDDLRAKIHLQFGFTVVRQAVGGLIPPGHLAIV